MIPWNSKDIYRRKRNDTRIYCRQNLNIILSTYLQAQEQKTSNPRFWQIQTSIAPAYESFTYEFPGVDVTNLEYFGFDTTVTDIFFNRYL